MANLANSLVLVLLGTCRSQVWRFQWPELVLDPAPMHSAEEGGFDKCRNAMSGTPALHGAHVKVLKLLNDQHTAPSGCLMTDLQHYSYVLALSLSLIT